MLNFKIRSLLPLVFVMFFCNSFGTAQEKPSQQLPTVTYDELLQGKDLYIGKIVRLNAVWTYGFEWTYLCSSECKSLEKAWVEMVDAEELCKGSTKRLKKMGKKFDNRARVLVQGKLQEGGGYGHLGAYKLKFVIGCVEELEKIY